MPIPSRDRLSRPVDISTLYRGAARKVDLIVDQPGLSWKGLSGNGSQNVSRGGSNSRARGVRVGGRGRSVQWSQMTGQRNRISGLIAQRSGGLRGRMVQQPQMTGQENRTPELIEQGNGGGQGRGINWPSWYRRRPLQDITALVEAIERRRAELNQTREAQQAENNAEAQQEETNAEPLEILIELEQEMGSRTPLPTVFAKSHLSPGTQAWKITPKNGENCGRSSGFLSPQIRLLNSIEKVREYWLEDQNRLQKTPAAKKAERETRVRTLMSMR